MMAEESDADPSPFVFARETQHDDVGSKRHCCFSVRLRVRRCLMMAEESAAVASPFVSARNAT
jgi:hypothetical protein